VNVAVTPYGVADAFTGAVALPGGVYTYVKLPVTGVEPSTPTANPTEFRALPLYVNVPPDVVTVGAAGLMVIVFVAEPFE
jgi:hypothetical protein